MRTEQYYMNIAVAVREKANCLGRKVGAILVRENRIISTGYNGTPEGMTNCMDGGCVRCRQREQFEKSVGYDVCICVHAEQNALITAARFGIGIAGSFCYSTMRPCFDCTKAMLQAKVHTIYYLHDWSHPLRELQEQYELLQDEFAGAVRQIKMTDPRADWANNVAPSESGNRRGRRRR
jgi:dCMP deaminase